MNAIVKTKSESRDTGALLTRRRSVFDEEREQHLKNLRIYGYTKLSGYLDDDLCAYLKGLVQNHYISAQDIKLDQPPEWNAAWLLNLQNKDKAFIDFLNDPVMESILIEKLNDPYHRFIPLDHPNYLLGYYLARSSGDKLDLHIDSHIPTPGPLTWSMQVIYLLDNSSIANGCSIVVPGSHLSGAYTDRSLEKTVPLEGKAGDVVMWDSRLWHGSMENVSGESRWALIATFRRWWVKSTYDIPRGLPEEIYQQLTDRQKALLGYCAIPPRDELGGRKIAAGGYEHLLPHVKDYYE